MVKLFLIQNPEVVITVPDDYITGLVGDSWVVGGPYPMSLPRHLWELVDGYGTPHNLEEAAENYSDEMWDELGGVGMVRDNEYDIWYPSAAVRTIFKAGARWMSEEGQVFEADVEGGHAVASGVTLPFNLLNTYKDGDKVAVQIRKK